MATLPQAILFDALGTLVELDDPIGRLTRALAGRGVAADAGAVAAALRAEIDHYRAEHHVAVDASSLAQLRRECAAVFASALGEPVAGLAPADLHDALLEGLRFRVFDDVRPVLAELRRRGVALAVVSNWDVSLHEVLAETGLTEHFAVVLTSAQERTAKPDPVMFQRALERLGGVPPNAAIHVGDDPVADAAGARAAGVEPRLLDRDGGCSSPPGTAVIRTLSELPGATA